MGEFGKPEAKEERKPSYRLEADFFGFSDAQSQTLRRTLESTRLPLNRIQEIHLIDESITDFIFKKWGIKESIQGDIFFLYDNSARRGHIVIPRTTLMLSLNSVHLLRRSLIHELAHNIEPELEDNIEIYMTEANRRAVETWVGLIIQQSLRTRRYINWYHKKLSQWFMFGKISYSRLLSEVFAILVEHRYMNPKKLQQVQDAQRRILERKGEADKHVPFTASEGNDMPAGIDEVLLFLMPDGNQNLDELNKITGQYRAGRSS